MAFSAIFIAIATIAAVASTVISVIQIFNPPSPSTITFGRVGNGGSPNYGSFGPLNNTVSNELAIPVLYGQLKIAGNVIWQTDPGQTVSRIIGLGEGQLNSITDIRANDIVINDTNTPGSSYTVYYGTGVQQADSRLPTSLRPDMELHQLAYIALTLAASDQLRGGNPTITSVCQGVLVETWDGTQWLTTKTYSNNPAACIRDFIINTRYGLGIAKANLDDASFGAVYDYCNGLVDGPSGKEARYQLDYIADAQRPASDILNEMLATFSGFLVYGKKLKLRCEQIDPIVQYFGDGSTTKTNATFDPGNIVKDSFSWNMSSIDERPNRIKIQWVDPSQNYVKIYTQVEDRIDQDDRGTVITKEISLLGITRASQASRMAKLIMAITKYSQISVQFTTRLDSIHCEVGDVIAVTHQSGKFTRRLFRITQMQEAENENISLVLREYNPYVYDDHQGSAILTYQNPSGPNEFTPLSDITSLTLTENDFTNKDGVFVTNILTNWNAISGDQLMRLDHYLVQLSDNGGTTYRDVQLVAKDKSSCNIVLGNVQTGTTFFVKVLTVSDKASVSAGTTASITITGKSTAPSNVADFSVVFAFDHIAMTWSSIDDADLFGYEIRSGDQNATWETASIVTTENLGTRFDLFNFTRGTKLFFIKAIDNSGNYSQNAASDAITITSIPSSNVVFTFDLFSRLTELPSPLEGTLSSNLERIPTSDYDPTYNRIALGPKPAMTYLDVQNTYATHLAFQQSTFRYGLEQYNIVQQSYISSPIDVGLLTSGAFILDIQTFSSSNLGFVAVYISTSTDGITYTTFSPFIAGQFSARYVKFQFLIQSTTASTKVRLTSAILTIDVPDINQSFLNQAIGSGGSTITLSGFTNVKSIVITTVGGSPLIPRITSQSSLPTSFDMVLDVPAGGTASGNVNIYVSGY